MSNAVMVKVMAYEDSNKFYTKDFFAIRLNDNKEYVFSYDFNSVKDYLMTYNLINFKSDCKVSDEETAIKYNEVMNNRKKALKKSNCKATIYIPVSGVIID